METPQGRFQFGLNPGIDPQRWLNLDMKIRYGVMRPSRHGLAVRVVIALFAFYMIFESG